MTEPRSIIQRLGPWFHNLRLPDAPLPPRLVPKLSFVERRLADDPTNWWAPNRACIEAMVRSSGLRVVERPAEEFFVCEPDPAGASNMWRWNEAEYWAAVGAEHQGTSPGVPVRPDTEARRRRRDGAKPDGA